MNRDARTEVNFILLSIHNFKFNFVSQENLREGSVIFFRQALLVVKFFCMEFQMVWNKSGDEEVRVVVTSLHS